MPGKCKGCRFFEPSGSRNYPFRGWGQCGKMFIKKGGPKNNPRRVAPPDGTLALAYDFETWMAGVYVSPQFGCVMYEEKNTDA